VSETFIVPYLLVHRTWGRRFNSSNVATCNTGALKLNQPRKLLKRVIQVGFAGLGHVRFCPISCRGSGHRQPTFAISGHSTLTRQRHAALGQTQRFLGAESPSTGWLPHSSHTRLRVWCPWRESNPHSLRNTILSRARLPVPPHGLDRYLYPG
jgi:hypothetical protein